MPLLVTFKGLPVKRRNRVEKNLRLVMFHRKPGQPGLQLIVSQEAWNAFGKIEFFRREDMPNRRILACKQRDNPTTPGGWLAAGC
jgi:hypothetical protein